MSTTVARRLADYLGGLTLAGGDHDGERLTLLPWERRFLAGVWGRGKGGAAGLSVGRGNGKSALVAAIACAVVDPAGPLHRRRGEVAIVASSFGQAKIVYEDCRVFLEDLLRDKAAWRVQDSQNIATIQHRETGSRIRCLGSDPRRLHGIRPLLTLCDEPSQWESTKAEAAYSALRTSLGKVPGSRLIGLGTRPASGGHWFSRLLQDAPYSQIHAAPKNAPPFRLSTWRRANPSLDWLPSLRAEIEEEAADARHDPDLLASFKSLRLNMGTADVVVSWLLQAAVWEGIEGEAAPSGKTVWGVDLGTSAAQSAVSCYWRLTGRLAAVAAFPELPTLGERGLADGVGNLYERCAARGELIQAGGHAVDVGALLHAALDRWGAPEAIWCDRWRLAELRGRGEAGPAAVLPGGGARAGLQGWRGGRARVQARVPGGPGDAGTVSAADRCHGGGADHL